MLAQIESALALPILGATLKLLLLVILLLAFRRGLDIGVRQVERRLNGQMANLERRRRLDTLLRAGASVAFIVVAAVVLITALALFGFNIGPVLASAGVAGLAISLGATTMIQDYIGGVIILAEDQFSMGDVVEVAGVSGEVVRMTLRATYLRDGVGKVYTVPNGSIRVIANVSRDWGRALVDLTVEYETDPARLERALHSVTERIKADPALAGALLGDLDTITWNGLSDWGVQVRLTAKTQPGQQGAVSRALRQFTIEALQAEGVRLAFPITNVRTQSGAGQTAAATSAAQGPAQSPPSAV